MNTQVDKHIKKMKLFLGLTVLLAAATQATYSPDLKKTYLESLEQYKKSNFDGNEKLMKKQCIVDNCMDNLGIAEGECGYCMGGCLEQVIAQKAAKALADKEKKGLAKCFKGCKPACEEVSKEDWSVFKKCKKGCWKGEKPRA